MADHSRAGDHQVWNGRILSGASGRRLDQVLGELVPGLSRAQAKRLIDEGLCSVDGLIAKSSARPRAGAHITLALSEPEADVTPEDIALEVLFEDEALVVVNKPAGMAAHPARGTPCGTLLNALAAHVAPQRPTLVHRLDRDTSGAILAAKTTVAHRELKTQMDEGTVERIYWAVVWGRLEHGGGTIDRPINRGRGDKRRMVVCEEGAPAVTDYSVLGSGGEMSLVRVKLQTGRTHQIRVHFEWLGHPLVGERTYRGGLGPLRPVEESLPGQALHSRSLSFDHPTTRQRHTIEAAPPEYLLSILGRLLPR